MILVTGGDRSGKSVFAEELAKKTNGKRGGWRFLGRQKICHTRLAGGASLRMEKIAGRLARYGRMNESCAPPFRRGFRWRL